ncbi:porin [Pararobbsia silviterrae]|uniref:Porin n=1 Tax=Pararobbsia silviterrae TaxID=1792498 RepID=A0A494Y9I4_9BURK|nr:porin [Pararobbsia silviterrae]RKP59294.1 porin [Pararobbsia silviterrae]
MAGLAVTAVAAPAFAQNSVTLYGIADNGFMYQSSASTLGSNSGGQSKFQIASGLWTPSRWGLKGSEDLGGGLKTIFQLENGFSIDSGAASQGGLEFGRIAIVGLSSDTYGTVTAGRNYTPYLLLLAPYGPSKWLSMHPGDVDGLDFTFHINNQLMYISPKIAGFTFGASYALGGVAGSLNQGSTWSTALQYDNGPFGIGVGFFRVNNSTPGGGVYGTASTAYSAGQASLSALTNGYQTAQAQQRFAITSGYKFSDALDLEVSYSNVQYIPGINSSYRNTATFNTGGILVHYKPTVAWDLEAGYAYTRATKANGISDEAQYNQFNLTESYALSKATSVYAFEAYQRASGQTLGTNGAGDVISATASIGDYFQSSPSSSQSQVGLIVGVIHRF